MCCKVRFKSRKRQDFGARAFLNTLNHNSAADWGRELLKSSIDAERLVLSIKKLVSFGFEFFWMWPNKWGYRLGLFDQGYLTLGFNPQGAIFVSFLNETWQKSACLKPLIGL